jgi:predicted CxxxxCH...CXXCH cytochrome family protein
MDTKQKRRRRRIRWFLLFTGLGLIVMLSTISVPALSPPWSDYAQQNRSYIVLAWNTLGMHCYNPDFQDFAVLPPYNVLWAQVVKVGDPPQFVTKDIKVEYRFPGNTYSVGKTNFWTYAKQLFGLTEDLPPNIGLAGKGLKGTMDLVSDPVLGDRFVAEGIPLTEYFDSDKRLQKPSPYQLAEITVRDAETRNILVQTMSTAPVSSELNCINCHADDGDATTRYPITPTGRVETNILALHDYLNQGNSNIPQPLMVSRPVLCARCHSSNALGKDGVPGVSSLSFAMHNHHSTANAPDITPNTTEGCYNCHPGPKTQCLRDTMHQSFSFNCTSCHGNMADVASPTLPLREPWLSEPRCDNVACHGPGYALDQPLYRNSRGHGGLYCAGCHDSPHAVAPSRELNDSIKFLMLQGQTNTLRKCTVCHATQPTSAFKHTWVKPAAN